MPEDLAYKTKKYQATRKPPERPITPPDQQDRQQAARAPAPPQRPASPAVQGEAAKTIRPRPAPVDALQKYGFHGPADEFVSRLEAVTDAHYRTTGTKPSPGLAFDVARSQVPLEQIPDLFGVPQSKRTARASKDWRLENPADSPVTRQIDQLDPLSAQEAEEAVFDEYLVAIREGKGEEYKRENAGPIVRKLTTDKRFAMRVWRAQTDADRERIELAQAGFPAKAIGFGGTAISQVTGGLLVGPPVLAYTEGVAVKHGVEQRSLAPVARANVDLAKAVAVGVREDFAHPDENPGYLALDILGILSLGGSTVARGAAAGAAKGAGAKARALVKKPRGGTVEYRRVGDEGVQTVRELLSENKAAAGAQLVKAYLSNRRAYKRAMGEDDSGLFSTLPHVFQESFSTETKIGRLSRVDARIEQAIANAPRAELEHVARTTRFRMKFNQHVPRQLRRGLSIGEQKALQVAFTDLQGDDLAKVARWREFHENMIDAAPELARQFNVPAERIIANHEAQLAALKLAGRVLKGPKSKSYVKAEALAREVVAEMEALKADELGLTPYTMQARVRSAGKVVETGEPVLGGFTLPKTDTAVYVPFISKARSKKQTTVSERLIAGPREGQYGIPDAQASAMRADPSLNHEFTGNSLRLGDFRFDTTNLIAEAYGRTVRAATILREYKDLVKGATKEPRSEFDIPIRTSANIPPRLREILAKVDEGEVDGEALLSTPEMESLHKHLFPGKKQDDGSWALDMLDKRELGKSVLWVDGRIVGGRNAIPQQLQHRTGQKIGQIINEPFRVAMLFLRPAYALNLLGNLSMMGFQDLIHTPPSLAKSLYSGQNYGPKVTRTLDALTGSGKAKGFTSDLESAALKSGQALAAGWHKLVDGWMRRASLITELNKLGYKGKKGLEDALFNEANRTDLNEAVRRANKAMVEFDNLTEFEKHVMRNVIFVYPWVSRSTVWSLRTIVEHPVKTAIVAHVGESFLSGELGGEEYQDVLAHAPEWYRKTGYIPVGWNGDGTPKVINPTSVNSFSTLAQLSGLEGVDELLGPFAKITMYAVTGRDDYGNELPGNDFAAAFKEVFNTLPQVVAAGRKERFETQEPLPPLNPADRDTYKKRYQAALKRMVLSPGWLGGLGTLIGGGLVPRTVDTEALEARYIRDLPDEERHKVFQKMLMDGLQLQATFLKKPLPDKVKEAVAVSDELTRQMNKLRSDGIEVSERMQDDLLIKLLADRGNDVGEKPGKDWTKREHTSFRKDLMNKYAGGVEMRDWNRRVKTVASFKKETLQRNLDVLAQEGLGKHTTASVAQDRLYQIGRDYLTYLDELKQRKDLVAGIADPDRQSQAYAELRAWEEEQDRPNGQLPSFPRLNWILEKTADVRTGEVARVVARRSWQTVPSLMKELLGKKPTPGLAQAWSVYETALADYRAANPFQARLSREQKVSVAKQINRAYPGFIRDWQFAQEPMFRRLQELKPIYQSPNKRAWRVVFDNAQALWSALATPSKEGISKTDANAAWKQYVRQLRPWIRENEPGLDRELQVYEEESSSFLFDMLR